MISTLLYALLATAQADFTPTPPSCAPDLGPFTQRLTCAGAVVDHVSERTIDVRFTLNAVHLPLEDDAGQVARVITKHRVELTRPVFKWFTRTRTYEFLETWAPECRREAAIVRCSGRNDQGRFEVAIDLTAKRAAGSYVSAEYPDPAYNPVLRFDALACE